MPEVVKSILYITRDHNYFIGQQAVDLYHRQNANRARKFVKKWAGELEYVGSEMRYIRDLYVFEDELKPGRLIQYIKTALRKMGGLSGYRGTQVFDQFYSVDELVKIYLSIIKQRAEIILKTDISGVVIGRPVLFSENPDLDKLAEDTLHSAALKAGFTDVVFEYEPVAAALYYEKGLKRSQKALIFDLGGGTLDIALVKIGDPGHRYIYASGGIEIAGSDFDRAIIKKRLIEFFDPKNDDMIPEIKEMVQAIPDWIALTEMSTPIHHALLKQALQERIAINELKRLESLIFNDLAFAFYRKVEEGKIALSSQGAALIRMDEKAIDIWELYTRYQFESDIQFQIAQVEKVIRHVVECAGMEPAEIDVVVKTGGSSNIPVFTEKLENVFGINKVVETNLFSSVTAGLAIRAHEIF